MAEKRTRRRLNSKDSELTSLIRGVNRLLCLICWIEVGLSCLYFVRTDNWRVTALMLQFTPIRYFFFDIAPEKAQKRPPSLDRSIPLAIFVRYLSRRFPIPQGGFLADIFGLFLASCRASVNGYALLWFDTFTFFFKDKTVDGLPTDGDGNIKFLHDNDRLKAIQDKLESSDDEESTKRLNATYEEWKKTRIASELDQWDFPIRRYLNPTDDYFKINEIGSRLMDDTYPSRTTKSKQKTNQ